MVEIGLALLITTLAWWIGTGLLLYVDGLPKRTYRLSMAAGTLILAVSLIGLFVSRDQTTPAGAYLGFFCGLGVWAWCELSFLTGWITGSRRTPCPPDADLLRRFGYGVQTLSHHEAAIAICGGIVGAILADAPNQTGLWTFVILWVMRVSAKLNLFLGVPHFTDSFLPPHLDYLKSYFRRASMNLLFPVSVTGGTIAAAWLAHDAWLPGATPHQTAAGVLLATLLALAVIEHWLMVLPVRDAALWAIWRAPKPPEAKPPMRRGDASTPKPDENQNTDAVRVLFCD